MSFSLERSTQVLRRTPGVLRAMLGDSSSAGGMDAFWTDGNYGPSTFSPFDVVGHLLHADRTNWMPRLRHILSDIGGVEPFAPFKRYAMFETSRGKSIDELLDAFAVTRAESLAELESMNLTPDDLERSGLHPDLGCVTAANLIAAWVVHDLNHTHQVAKAMAYQYKDAVGPWAKLLGILPKS
jgi:hypothetical protein